VHLQDFYDVIGAHNSQRDSRQPHNMFILATLMPNTRELSHFTTANWEKLPFTRTKHNNKTQLMLPCLPGYQQQKPHS
jgi:hypothetical protein